MLRDAFRCCVEKRKPLNFRDGESNVIAYRISCSNEVLKTDLKAGRLIWLVITLLGSRHFACDDFVNDATKVDLGVWTDILGGRLGGPR